MSHVTDDWHSFVPVQPRLDAVLPLTKILMSAICRYCIRIEACTKYHCRYLHATFSNFYIYWFFILILFYWRSLRSIQLTVRKYGSCGVMAPNRRQAFTWPNDGPVLWRLHTVRCRYNAINILQNPHNRCNRWIACPWGRDVGCLLGVWNLNHVLLMSLNCYK